MKSPELESSATFGAACTGLGVAGITFASASSSSTSSPSSPSLTKTPRWGSIRQRFSSIQSRESPSVPVDSVDDGMWDKNDAAFLEEVARDSPLLLASPDHFDSLAPVFEDTYTGRASTSSSRVPSFIRIGDPDSLTHLSPHSSLSHRQSLQHRPSSASSSTPSSATSAASPMSTPVVTHDEMSGPSQASGPVNPWPRSMRRMASSTMLPDLPEQIRTDDFITFSRPSTASSSSAVPISPPLLPPIGSSASFMSGAFANAHLIQSPNGKGSAHSGVRSNPSLTHNIDASSDATRSAIAEQYPRSPSLHSSSSFTTNGFTCRSQDDRCTDNNARVRTLSSASASSSTVQHSAAGIDRRTIRSIIGSPLVMRTSFSSSRPSSPDAFLQCSAATSSSPILSRIAAEHGATAFSADSSRRPSIASVMESPYTGPASQPFPSSANDGADEFGGQASATARGKRMASASMRGVPGSPTKKIGAAIAPESAFATSSTATATSGTGASNAAARKHTKNKSSLVSGLRKLMGKREREGKGSTGASSDSTVAAGNAFMRPSSPSPEEQPAPGDSDAAVAWPSQPPTDQQQSMRTRATSIDAPQHGGLNLFGLAPDALGSGVLVEASLGRNQSLKNQAGRSGSNAGLASPSMACRSPSLDLLRSFGTMGKASQAGLSGLTEQAPAAPASPRSRTKSIDALTRPLREVLGQRSRKDSSNQAAARASVIEHISHNDARRLTGSTGPVILQTKEALEQHRAQYATFPSEIGLLDRSNFDMHHQVSAPSHQGDKAHAAAADPSATGPASSTGHASVQLPARPPRPEGSSPEDSAPMELLTPSNSGEMVGGSSSNVGGISSSGSSFVSASSAVTDPSMTMRQPFSFQSQPYRPHSRESRGSQKVQPSPPSSPSSLAFHLSGDAAALGLHDASIANGDKFMHRAAPSLGSLASLHSGQILASSDMLPPLASAQPAKRGHSSRRSLNSLVSGSKPWSSLLGSPILGSSSSLSHHKRVSTASISRPMSVTSSAFSSDMNDLSADVADLTLRPSDFGGAPRSRIRVDSQQSNFSEPGNFLAWQPAAAVEVAALNLNNSSSVHFHSQTHSHSHSLSLASASSQGHLSPPSGPHLVALAPPAAPTPTTVALSSGSSQHSHHSRHSHQSYQSHQSHNQSGASTASASSGALAPAIANAQHRLGQASSSSGLRQQAPSPSPLRRPATIDGDLTQHLPSSEPSSSTPTTSPPAASAFLPTTALGFSSRQRPSGAGHRSSLSGSSLSHRKRPSFGLAIEPAAHSAFDSIPSPLLRTRRISLALPEGAAPQRPFSTSSASVGRTTSGSSSSTSPNGSARVSAATLSSSHVFESEDNTEIETLLDGSPTKKPLSAAPFLFKGSVPALESAMAAASLESTPSHRHSVSVPMDEGDSPRQHQEESWNRATGGTILTYGTVEESHPAAPAPAPAPAPRQYMIHSPNEEEGPALAMSDTTPSSGRMSQATKDIAFGSIAGMVSKVFEHPFDLVKVRLQTQSADRPPRYAGAFDCFKQTYLQEGIRGLYRGLSMPVVGATLENACLFFTYNQIQSAIRWANGEAKSGASAAQADAESPLSIPQLAIAAAGAGAVTSLVLTPIELIKCKMQVQMITREQHVPLSTTTTAAAPAAASASGLQQSRSIYTSAVRRAATPSSSAEAFKALDGPLTLLRRTIAADGIRGLWLGQTGTLLRETGGGVAWFLAFESCSRYLIARKKAQWKRQDVTKKDLTSLELVGAGALAGVSYNVVLFPADCVKSTMQTEQEMRAMSSTAKAGEKWKGTGFYDTFKKIYRTRGVRGLYAGCGVTCLRSAPSSAIIFLMYNKLEKMSDVYGF